MVLRACGRNYWKNTEGNNQIETKKLSTQLRRSAKDLIEIKVRRDNNDNDDTC